MGRPGRPTCQARPRLGRRPIHSTPWPNAIPHDVLGVEPGAEPDADQGRVAAPCPDAPPRPDRRRSGRIADRDPADGRDQRRLRRADPRRRAARRAAGRRGRRPTRSGGRRGAARTSQRAVRRSPRPTRPVTGRVDTTDNVRPRNQTRPPPAARPAVPSSRRPAAVARATRQPRAAAGEHADRPAGARSGSATSAGRSRRRSQDALELELGFGKFHGHTLGQIAAFEPSYIDWLATTITRDPELVAAARVVRDELDRRGHRAPGAAGATTSPGPAGPPDRHVPARRRRPRNARSPPGYPEGDRVSLMKFERCSAVSPQA